MSAPEAVTVYRTVGGEWRKTGNGAYTTHEYRALPAAQYAALVAERDALREALQAARTIVLFDSAEDTQLGSMRRAMLARIDTALGAERG